MKQIQKLIILGLVLSFTSLSCQKDLDPVLGDPDQRQREVLQAYETQLINAEYGWNGYIYTELGGGYSFHMDFKEDGQVDMRGDLNQETVAEVQTSTWRLKSSQQSLLIFDTYSYIHWLSDPNTNIFDGEPGKGLMSDYEFAFLESTQDTLYFKGKLNQVDFYLIRSSKEEADAWASGAVLEMETIIQQHRFAQDGENLKMMINPEKKTVRFDFQGGESLSLPYTYTHQGINLKTGLQQGGYAFTEVIWDAQAATYAINSEGGKVSLDLAVAPLFPLESLLGYGKEYDRLLFDGELLDPSLSSGLQARWAQAKENNLLYMGPPIGRALLDYALMEFLQNDQVCIYFKYKHPVEGTLFTVRIWCKMERDSDNRIQFTYIKHDNNTLFNDAQIMRPFTEEFFASLVFTLDWVEAGDAPYLVGGLIQTGDPADFFYGILQ